jgi:hypothetical protein
MEGSARRLTAGAPAYHGACVAGINDPDELAAPLAGELKEAAAPLWPQRVAFLLTGMHGPLEGHRPRNS